MRTAVITIVHGRHGHLLRQVQGLTSSTVAPDLHVVVAMGDPNLVVLLAEEGSTAIIIDCPAGGGPLPLARARNTGAETALQSGADLLVFLDVDCIPGARLIERYETVARCGEYADALLCGPVTYLEPPGVAGYDLASLDTMVKPHPGRPAPPEDAVVPSQDYHLFWSLSFAVSEATWTKIGGFCEEYHGYGGEDTDFGFAAAASGVPMYWVGGAHAFHQHHSTENPPLRHLDDILHNAATFYRRWGSWPMEGWLDDFEVAGLIERAADGTPTKRIR